ncbi:branched-chain-amino-acid transaminase [Saccharomycopsis crataegensis]|uniref:Branched-chain-amino-acid aminotransferase n=1 Tax=Saccharomycopsis crataegensis TaxID=43959 RepID=A0AAV5QUF0_9ASCO|nr:branched-chain-amino-acid transaminase [Saccharomycopsis crataegensis]
MSFQRLSLSGLKSLSSARSTFISYSQRSSITNSFRTMSTAPLDASKLKINKTASPKAKLPNEQLVFGKSFTDHMLTVDWDATTGWGAPEIKPYAGLCLDPSSIVFHYGFELFEGMKAYRDANNKLRMFRPDMNMIRMNKSAERIALPTFDSEELIKLIGKLVELDADFVPQGEGYSLYIRPTLIGTDAGLGIGTPSQAKLFVICSPVGPYYSTGFKAVTLEATNYATRAWPGGCGNRKLGANYAPCVLPQKQAASRGYQQNLWLFGPENYVTEVGSMNLFFAFKDSKTGKKELVTAPLDGTILEGITRDSILALGRERLDSNEWEVNERYLSIDEVAERALKGELLECFGSGTAAVVSPVKTIGWNGKDISVPLLEGKQYGALTKQFQEWISALQYGKEEFKNWSRVIN